MGAKKIIEKARPILLKYGIKKAELFGSAARGDMTPKSDIDILVEFPPHSGFKVLGGVYRELKDALNRDVDVVSYEAVHPYIKKYVFSSTLPII